MELSTWCGVHAHAMGVGDVLHINAKALKTPGSGNLTHVYMTPKMWSAPCEDQRRARYRHQMYPWHDVVHILERTATKKQDLSCLLSPMIQYAATPRRDASHVLLNRSLPSYEPVPVLVVS